ncbi:hypothetical protein PHPALM_31607 [Phytophthora palmivora]|uniref:Uncharacterized protein n=1 Tax=Phytophthora palmivora TaxID=4796 RepID=A0A2P4X256_9STRA|nr:hypothetical protein PHPALM_31607 [Phytophthora palmivora]
MDLLEEFMPDMADVLAAQEGALMSVISALTTQLQQLVATNEWQAQRMTQLESTQVAMQQTIKELQDTPAPAPVVVEVPSEPDTAVVDAMLSSRMDQLQENVQLQVAEQMQQNLQQVAEQMQQKMQQVAEEMQQVMEGMQGSQSPDDGSARAFLELKFRELNEKVNAQIGELRSEATDSLVEKTKQTEEAIQSQLEQFEKRFEYLSRVKMEVKDLMRRADRQEQSLEDVRVGIEVLAKSLGSEDVESETSEEENESAEEEVTEETPPQQVRKTALHSIPVIREKSEAHIVVDASTPETASESVQTEIPKPTSANADNLAVPTQDHVVIDVATPQSTPLRSKSVTQMSKYVRRSLRRLRHATEPSIPALTSVDVVEPLIPEAVVEHPIDEVDTPEPETQNEPLPQQPEDERTTETVAAPVEPVIIPEAPVVIPEAPVVIAEAPVVITEAPVVTPDADNILADENQVVLTPEDQEDQGKIEKEVEQEVPEDLPQQYRSQVASQQKEMSDHVELFRSPSSSRNLMGPNVVTPVVRARRQRRQSNRKESDAQSNDQQPSTPHDHSRNTVRKSISPPPPLPVEPRQPLTKARIRELWMILLGRLVQMVRLRQLNGINAEKALFRQKQMSMGSRVKRLEENTTRLDESLEYLERHVQDNSSAINALDESILELQPVVERVQKMERTQKAQARTIVDVEEKLQEFDVEIQRLRTSTRRTSSISSNVTSAVTNAIAAQLQDVTAKFSSQASAFEASEKLLAQVSGTEIPALHDKLELSLYTLRQEAEQRTSETAQELRKIVEQLQTSQRSSDGNLLLRITEFCNRIYHTLLGMSGAMLQSVELSKSEQSAKMPTRSLVDVGIDLLHGIFAHFITNCKTLFSQEVESEIDFLVETAMDFQQQLNKLKSQAAIAKVAAQAVDTSDNNGSAATPAAPTSSFDDHLVFITTTKLKELEGALITREAQKEDNQTPQLILFMHDAVIQVRSVLFLLLLHTEATNSRHQVEDLRSSHVLVQNRVEEHGFALGHLDSTIAMVKMMNSRLDSFMELSFSYAKEDDVKKSIEELMTANNDMRELLTTSLDATRSETLERDGLLGEEMNQLIARVSKKLDKDSTWSPGLNHCNGENDEFAS